MARPVNLSAVFLDIETQQAAPYFDLVESRI
jgi:hypothetical protein